MEATKPSLALSELTDATVFNKLKKLDKNGDGKLTFNETEGQTLLTPTEESAITITNSANWASYNLIVHNHANHRQFLRFMDSQEIEARTKEEGVTAEKWLADLTPEILTDFLTTGFANTAFILLDTQPFEDGYQLLVKHPNGFDRNKTLIFTVNLHHNPELNTLQIGKALFKLSDFMPDPRLEGWRKEFLKNLYSALIDSAYLFPDDFLTKQIELIEALAIHANPEMIGLYENRRTSLTQNTGHSEPQIFTHPPLIISSKGAVFSVPLSSEKPLTPEEYLCLQEIMYHIPQELSDILISQDVISQDAKTLTLRVVSHETMQRMGFGWAIAAYYPDGTMSLIHSSLRHKNNLSLTRTFNHELAHALSQGGSFRRIQDFPLVKNVFLSARQALSASYNPAVTPYALNIPAEFFAESVTAYFVGETDKVPNSGPYAGPLSRGELRQKQPQLYVALRLFFEMDSRVFGTSEIFSERSSSVIDRMFSSPEIKRFVLSPDTPAQKISEIYSEFTKEKKAVANLVDLHKNDAQYGEFDHRYVYRGLDVDKDGNKEKILVHEQTRYITRRQKWESRFTVVILKTDGDKDTQRLEIKFGFEGDMTVPQFLEGGLNPLFHGLFVVDDEKRNSRHLRIKTHLNEVADIYLNLAGDKWALKKQIKKFP